MARSWFIKAVRSPTSRSRARWRVCMSSCSELLRATKRMVGRVAASAIASATRSSFLCAFTYGRTYLQHASKVVGAAAGLHSNNTGRQLGGEQGNAVAPHPAAQDDPTCLVEPCQTAAVLTKSIP